MAVPGQESDRVRFIEHAESEMSSEIAETTPQPEVSEVTRGDQNRHPTALWFFFWGEFAERCSYYGMRAILPLYLASVMAFSAGHAGTIYSWF